MSAADIHPSAIVEDGAEIGSGCRIGPFCHVGADVKLASGVHLKSHVVVCGDTEIGEDTVVFPSPFWVKYRKTSSLRVNQPS